MTTQYLISRKQLATLKRAAKHMGLGWQAEAARPSSAVRLCDAIERLGLEDGCEEWGRQNRDAAREAGLLSDDTLLMGNDGEPVRAGDIDKPKTERIRDGIKSLIK